MSIDVKIESENCNFLKYGRIGKHPMQSLYTRYILVILHITGYGSTLYIGIAMVFVFSPYIWKFSSYFRFQLILTFNDFKAQHMSTLSCMPNISLKYHLWPKLYLKICIIFFFFFFFLSLNSRNSITIVPTDIKLDVWTRFGDSYNIVSGPQIIMLTLLLPEYLYYSNTLE